MHEVSIVQALLREVEAQVSEVATVAIGVVTRLELTVGRVSGVNAEALRFAFEVLSEGTCVEGAELEIVQPPVARLCLACRARTESDEVLAGCPACGSDEVRLEGGRDLVLASLEIKEPSEQRESELV